MTQKIKLNSVVQLSPEKKQMATYKFRGQMAGKLFTARRGMNLSMSEKLCGP